MEWILLGLAGLLILGLSWKLHQNAVLIARVRENNAQLRTLPPPMPPQVNVDLAPLRDDLARLPGKVLQSITGATNYKKGALGELIGYLQLSAEYDRIIPLGNIVDFVCIRFPSETREGQIDFIDIKANGARLNKDQKRLQDLLKEGKVGFKKVKVETSDYQPGTGKAVQ